MEMDVMQIDPLLKLDGCVVEAVLPQETPAQGELLATSKTTQMIQLFELLSVETDLKQEQKDVMMETRSVEMAEKQIALGWNQDGCELEGVQLQKMFVLNEIEDGNKIAQLTQRLA